MKAALHETGPAAHPLFRAILLYGNPKSSVIAVEHKIVNDHGTPRLGTARFVTNGVAAGLLKLFERAPLQYVPPNVVALSHQAIAWFEPATKRRMLFEARDDAALNALDNAEIPQPPLIFIARSRSLSAFALYTNERPTLDTKLAMAPYWNVNSRGDVCLGSAEIPKTINPTETDAWTKSFFGSNFTHISGSKVWAHPGTYAEMLTDAIEEDEFKTEWLRESGRTLREAICSN